MFRYGFVFLMVLFITNCTQFVSSTKMPDITFEHIVSRPLAVSQIEVSDKYTPPLQSPNVEHLFKTPPYIAIYNFIQNSYHPAAEQGYVHIIIEEASVVKENLPIESGFKGLFEKPMARYTGKVKIRIEARDISGQSVISSGHASVLAERSRTIKQDTPLKDKFYMHFELTESLIADVQKGIEDAFNNKIPKILK